MNEEEDDCQIIRVEQQHNKHCDSDTVSIAGSHSSSVSQHTNTSVHYSHCSITSDGAGSVIGDGAGSVVGDGVGSVVGDGAGSVIGDGAGSVVGDGVGSVVGDGAGSVIGDGAGSVIGDGAGSVIGDVVSVKSEGSGSSRSTSGKNSHSSECMFMH